jgi:malonyl-CoA/methylmalonyl-CoA synthetase
VQTEKSVEALMLYLAVLRAGYVYLPLNTAYQAAEIEYFIGNAEPAVVVCSGKNFRLGQPDRLQGRLHACVHA